MKFLLANDKDVKDIYAIASSWKYETAKSIDEGFLVSEYTIEDYEAFFKDDDKYLFVAKEDNEVLGFIYGYYVEHGGFSKTSLAIKDMAEPNDFILKQIAVKKERRKVGAYLINHLLTFIDSDIYLAIVSKPLNVASVMFHRKHGFIKAARIMEDDNLERLIYAKYKDASQQGYKDFVMSEYQTAVDLYKHEDHLTWTKFNFSIITNGALLSLLIPNLSGDYNVELFSFFIFVIILINLGYIYTIFMGRKYLKNRKETAVNIEERLERFGMRNIIKSNDKDLKSSKTSIVQYSIPLVFTVGWIVILLVILGPAIF